MIPIGDIIRQVLKIVAEGLHWKRLSKQAEVEGKSKVARDAEARLEHEKMRQTIREAVVSGRADELNVAVDQLLNETKTRGDTKQP